MRESRSKIDILAQEIRKIAANKNRDFGQAYGDLSELIHAAAESDLREVAKDGEISLLLKDMLSNKYNHVEVENSSEYISPIRFQQEEDLLLLQEQEKKLGFTPTKLKDPQQKSVDQYIQYIQRSEKMRVSASTAATKRNTDERNDRDKESEKLEADQVRTKQLNNQMSKAYEAFNRSSHTSFNNTTRAFLVLNVADNPTYKTGLERVVGAWFDQYNAKLSKRTGFFGSKIQTADQFVEQLLNKKQKGHHYSRVLSLILQAQIINNEESVKKALVNLLKEKQYPKAEDYASQIINQLRQATIKVEGKNKNNYAVLMDELSQSKNENKRTFK